MFDQEVIRERNEKIVKMYNQQLNQAREEIREICFGFDKKLKVLFKEKLEFDYRINEFELYIVCLSLSIKYEN